jgi:hypothetical protein
MIVDDDVGIVHFRPVKNHHIDDFPSISRV